MNNEEKAVLIQGKIDINRAVDGDQVVIEVYPKKDWKAESELLVLNDNEEDETATETAASPAEKQISGRVVAIVKRNWKP